MRLKERGVASESRNSCSDGNSNNNSSNCNVDQAMSYECTNTMKIKLRQKRTANRVTAAGATSEVANVAQAKTCSSNSSSSNNEEFSKEWRLHFNDWCSYFHEMLTNQRGYYMRYIELEYPQNTKRASAKIATNKMKTEIEETTSLPLMLLSSSSLSSTTSTTSSATTTATTQALTKSTTRNVFKEMQRNHHLQNTTTTATTLNEPTKNLKQQKEHLIQQQKAAAIASNAMTTSASSKTRTTASLSSSTASAAAATLSLTSSSSSVSALSSSSLISTTSIPSPAATTSQTLLPSSSSSSAAAVLQQQTFTFSTSIFATTTAYASWLLPLLCLVALFSCGHAGFACLSNPCVFGVCIDGLNSSYSCYCIDGYTGIQCQTNWDECWSGPCQNGGTCVDGVAYYNCTCPDGFTGSNCEENVDECMSNPCQNGGHCRDRNNGYTCTCQPGYLGINCDLDVAVCETGTGARCQNGGECLEGPGLEFSCECTAGWHGRICQEEINECESAPCQNGGVCVDKLAAYVCACPMGYTGNNCEEEILICADNPCQNNALCLMEEGVPTCYCVPDYHGMKCEYQYDECQLGPRCMNGGVCIDGVDTFSCSCPPLLTGMLCECLMIGEDSLDCNYTAPSTIAPPASTTKATVLPPATSEMSQPTVPGAAAAITTAAAPELAVSTSEEEEEKSHENGGAVPQLPATTTTPGSISISAEGDSKQTTESSHSYTAESVSSSESSYSSEGGSISIDIGSSIEYTTVPRFDVSSSQEGTTVKTTSAAVDADYTPILHSGDVSTSGESEEQPGGGVAFSTRPSFTQYVTTIETISIDYSTLRPSLIITPTYHPTISSPVSTMKPIAPGRTAAPIDDSSESSEHEVGASTHRIWPEVTTTAVPFFTEYPEVYVTTRYHDFTSKDLSTSSGRFTTYQPPTPPYHMTTISAHDYETLEAGAAATTTTSARPQTTDKSMTHHHHHHHHHPTTYTPQQETTEHTHYTHRHETHTTEYSHHHHHTTEYPHHHHHHYHNTTIETTYSPPAPPSMDVTTISTLYTEDLVSPHIPVALTTEATTGTTTATTIEIKPIITYLIPTLQPPAATTFAPPAPTLPPQPSSPPAYSTHPPTLVTKPLITTTAASSEEVESSNTVATGVDTGAGRGAPEVGGDNVTAVDCIKSGCYNGGTCVTTSEGSRCVCRFDRQGALCEEPIIIKNAAFSGDSYVSHRIHKDIPNHETLDSVLPMHVQLKVRTRATNGLIMLAAAQGTKGGHYMALFLQKGLLQFQFSCGLQTMLLSELETPVNTGNEITIRAELDFSRNYTHCNASLLVNDTLAMSGDQPTWLKLLPARLHTPEAILNTWLHLGGAPQAPIGLIIELPPAQSGTGFTGCLHSLRINGEAREIFGDALDGFGITECGSLACLSSPCRNGAACIKIETNEVDENGDKTEKWKCKCPTGYMGPTCEISVCEDNPCQYGGTCVQFPGSGYLCLCPLGKHGHYCEHNLEVALPSFSGSVNGLSSFVAYTVPIPLEYSIELSFKILPQTMSQISLLAFLGQTGYHDEKSDHLAVSFIQGYIMLTWNLGGGPRRIFTQKPIDFRLDAPRVPYEIKVGRIGRQAWLSVDGKFNITGRSPGSVSRMDVMPILYLGGHEMTNFNTLPHDLPLHSGFQGCIYDVNLKAGQVTVPLQETRGVRGRGVGQCGTRECHRHACQHDGACLQHGATFTCICQEGWYGPLCAQPINPCDSFNNKCFEDSTCVPLVNGYECDCPVGKTGKNCEEDIRSLSDVSLTGRRSYLAVRWPYLYDGGDKLGSKRSQIVSYRNFTKKLMPPKPISSPSQHFVMKLLNEVEKQRNFSPVPLMGSKSFEEHHRVQFFFIEFQLRPLSERGLLLYFGTLNNNQDKKVGFVSLSLQGGVVEFRISGPSNHVTVVRSVRMLAIGEWHKIKMAQRGRWLTLWVEGSASSALAPSAEVLVEPDSLLYIGGLKDLSKLPYNAISGFPIPFRGCVRGLVVSGTRIVLNETNILDSRNIRDCDGTACGGDSCEAGGHCWLDEKLQPHCICPEYAKGDRCEYSESCKLVPCKNNGRCLRSGRCSCPNGWGGFYCEIAMSKPTTPSFRGNSYLILPPPRIPMKDKRKGPSMYVRPREALQIQLNFSTIEPDGLLLWSEHERTTKFLGLGLENGHLKIASNLLGTNNDTVATPSSGFIADGSWHLAKVIMDRTRLELQLDGDVIFTEKLASESVVAATATTAQTITTGTRRSTYATRRGKEPSITYEDVFFLGGFPNMETVSTRTQGRFLEPFKGCLQDIQFGADTTSIITDFSTYKGENIGSCDLHGDEPIIV